LLEDEQVAADVEKLCEPRAPWSKQDVNQYLDITFGHTIESYQLSAY
jgi:predicted AAA+ superfamily ATPase